MKNNIGKNLLGALEKAVKMEVQRNEKSTQFCPVILHQPKRPKKKTIG